MYKHLTREQRYAIYLGIQKIEKYSHLATLQEVAENDYNLNIPLYVDTFEKEEPIDIHAVMRKSRIWKPNEPTLTRRLKAI